MQDISSISHHLIGISFLEDEENKYVKAQWEARFSEEYADWISGEDSVSDVITQILKLRKSYGRKNLAGLNVVLAGFYDLRQSETAQQKADLLKDIREELAGLNVNVYLLMQFGYVGDIPSPVGQDLQNCVKLIAKKQIGRLCMVGKSAYDEEYTGYNWKAVIVLLDLLRRYNSPGSLLPKESNAAADTLEAVGFLRYGEHSQDVLDRAQSRLAEIEDLLDVGTDDGMRNGFLAALQEIETDAPRRFPVDGSKQPIHPDMLVKPKKIDIGGKSRKRLQEAQNATIAAVVGTGDRMIERMREEYIPTEEQAEWLVRQIIEKKKVSLGLIEGITDLCGQLKLAISGEMGLAHLSLPYDENGYSEPITDYLIKRRDYGVLMCRKEKLEKMAAAFRKIQPEYVAQIKVVEAEKRDLEKRMKGMVSRDAYLNDVITAGMNLECCFNPTKNYGAGQTYILWRAFEDGAAIEKKAPAANYKIDLENGGLKTVDEGQIKTVKAFFARCTDVVVQDLIRQKK